MQEHDGHRARLKERFDKTRLLGFAEIGRASCRERV